MEGEVMAAAAAERVDRRVVPDVGSIPTVTPQLHIVGMRLVADPVDEHHLVLRTVQPAHARVRLAPDADIEPLAVDLGARGDQLLDMVVVHTHEMDSAVSGDAGASAEDRRQPDGVFRRRHLPRGLCELGMLDATLATNVSN